MNLVIPHGFETNYTVGFARGLAANGVEIVVISDDDIAPRLDKNNIPHLNLRGSLSPKRSRTIKLGNLIRYYCGLLSVIASHRGQIVHFTGLLSSRIILFDGILLPLWMRLWSRRYIYTAHNALPHSREQSRLFRWAYRWIYRVPHTILVHSDSVARRLETEFDVAPERIKVISIGLNTEVPASTVSRDEARKKLGLSTGPRIGVCFGKVERYKGVDLLVQAWGGMHPKGGLLFIVGSAQDHEHAREIRTAIDQSPRRREIEWREGFVANDEVALWLTAADFAVLPYRQISQSGVIFLCLRFGLPIVATDVGSFAEFVDEKTGVLASSATPVAITEALERFFATAGHFNRNQIAKYAEQYSWERQCARIRHLYNTDTFIAENPAQNT